MLVCTSTYLDSSSVLRDYFVLRKKYRTYDTMFEVSFAPAGHRREPSSSLHLHPNKTCSVAALFHHLRVNTKKIVGIITSYLLSRMPPVLKPEQSKVDGLVFIGLSLARKSDRGHPDSVTHQIAFDFNDIIDRNYEFLQSTNDDGWLVGGGEPGPPKSYKLPAKDSAHVEIMRVGTYNPEWGGISEKEIIEVLKSGKILIPQIEVLPTQVVANGDSPPELEIRFDMPYGPDFVDMKAPLPPNWQLRFIHNQLFKHFYNPSRFCPGAFHSTIVRKAEFRSEKHKDAYFAMCDAVLKKWRINGPRPLNATAVDNKSGLWLFTDRSWPNHFFPPNFLPPYDTDEKRQIILSYLTEEWDEKSLSWRTAQYPEKKSDSSTGFMDWCGNPIEVLLGGRGGTKPMDAAKIP